MKVYRDAQGNLINIGEWDINDGKNPIPNGAVESDESVVTAIDGSRVLSSNYKELRRLEYPDFKDYLDGIVKNDQTQINLYIQKCQAVKAKYPKN